MKQILQNMSTGETTIVTAPAPSVSSGTVLIESKVSLISAGTERMLVDFGNASMVSKARKQPEKVKMVLEKVKTDGLFPTIEAVKSKLEQPLPLGYCNVGTILAVGDKVHGFRKGDRIVSNGPHADVVRVVENLCAKIPDNVSDEEASFTVLAAIGLQGIRLLKPTLGEAIVVIGAGLIGLAAIQMLLANGCRVLAIDFDGHKLDLAKKFGAEIYNLSEGGDPVAAGMTFSRGAGVDGVLITASTQSNDPVSQAANMCRTRGRIILVGVTGLTLNRAEFYDKELSFQVSCSYGPGRYDVNYEDNGNDYPIGFVRWTEQRNFEAVLDLLSAGKIDVKPLISHRFLFDDANAAYAVLTEDKSALGIVLEYSTDDTKEKLAKETRLSKGGNHRVVDNVVVGFVGAGNYASRVLIPAFKETGAELHTIVTSGGSVNGVIHGNKNGFLCASTDIGAMLSETEINTVSIVTQHNTHAKFVQKAIASDKNVFVEKPLAIHLDDLEAIQKVYEEKLDAGNAPILMVGFNRRFSPQIQKIKSLLRGTREPKSFIMTMNAGAIPADHWTQDPEIGGGRIIGEACHFIDLMRFLADSPIISMQGRCMGNTGSLSVREDKAAITLGFADGSFGTIHYLANGASNFPKERIEIFCEGKVLQLDNFRKLKGYGWKGFGKMNLWSQDKGQKACAQAFIKSIKENTASPIPVDEIFEVAQASIEIANQLREQS